MRYLFLVILLTFSPIFLCARVQQNDLLESFHKGVACYESGDYDSAVQHFEFVYSNNYTNPSDSIFHLLEYSSNYLGYIYYMKGDLPTASRYSYQYKDTPLPIDVLSEFSGLMAKIERKQRQGTPGQEIVKYFDDLRILLEGYFDKDDLTCYLLPGLINGAYVYFDFDSFKSLLANLKECVDSSSTLTPNARAFYLLIFLYYSSSCELIDIKSAESGKIFNELCSCIELIPSKDYTRYAGLLVSIAELMGKHLTARQIAKQAIASPFCSPNSANYLEIHHFLFSSDNNESGFINFLEDYFADNDITFDNFDGVKAAIMILVNYYLENGQDEAAFSIIRKMRQCSKEIFGQESQEYRSSMYLSMQVINSLSDYVYKGELMSDFMVEYKEVGELQYHQPADALNYYSMLYVSINISICCELLKTNSVMDSDIPVIAFCDNVLNEIRKVLPLEKPNNFYALLYEQYCKFLELRYLYQYTHEDISSILNDERLYQDIDFLPEILQKYMLKYCAAICSYKSDYEGFQSYLEKIVPTGDFSVDLNLAALYARKAINPSAVEDLCFSSYNQYLRMFSLRVLSTNPLLANEFGMTEEETDYTMYFTYIASKMSIDNPVINAVAFNFLLLNNGVHLNFEKELSRIAESDSLVRKLIDESRLKYQTILESYEQHDNYSTRRLFQELSITNQQLMNILIDQGYINDILQLDCSNLVQNLNTGDVMIEFAPVPKDLLGNSGDNICALFMQKGWDYPKFALTDSPNRDTFTTIPDFLSDEKFGDEIWESILGQCELNEKSNIYFTIHPALQTIPFENLHYQGRQKVSSVHNLYRLSSLAELALKKNRGPKEYSSAALFGGVEYKLPVSHEDENSYGNNPFIQLTKANFQLDSLPFSLPEVNDISSILIKSGINENRIDAFTGEYAREDRFKELSGKPTDLLLISTHGFVFDNNITNNKERLEMMAHYEVASRSRDNNPFLPMNRAFLALAGAQNTLSGQSLPDADDGILSAQEISKMKLWDTDLAVLSSCNSGLGGTSSDGVMGLVRGLKLAGVRSVLMTLWPVDDKSTYLLMKEFFSNLLLRGQTKIKALSNAQDYLAGYEGPTEEKTTKSVIIDGMSFEEEVTETVIGKPYSDPKYWAGFVLVDAY